MTLDDRIRRGLTRRASDGELDIDHELGHVLDVGARRSRCTRTVRVAVVVALVLALGTTGLVLSAGETIIRPAMMATDNAPLSAVQTSAYDAVRIPYLGGASMQLIIPTAGQFDQVESQLSGDLLAQIRAAEASRAVRLTMPKFKFSTRALLNDDLEALGMRDAFTGRADFAGLSPSRDLDIKSVVHQATVSVDEAGTEATAATGVGVQLLAGVGSRGLTLTVDRPFLVVIEDEATHAVLFAGRVTNPDAH